MNTAVTRRLIRHVSDITSVLKNGHGKKLHMVSLKMRLAVAVITLQALKQIQNPLAVCLVRGRKTKATAVSPVPSDACACTAVYSTNKSSDSCPFIQKAHRESSPACLLVQILKIPGCASDTLY